MSTSPIAYVEIRYRKVPSRPEETLGAWKYVRTSPTDTQFTLTDVERGATYTVQARNVTVLGTPSDWVETAGVVGAASIKTGVTQVSVLPVADGIYVSWGVLNTLPAGTDFEVQFTGVADSKSDGDYAFLGRTRSQFITHAVVDGATYYYRVRAINFVGNVSPWVYSGMAKAKTVEDGADNSGDVSPTAVLNPSFDAGDTLWTKGDSWLITNTGVALTGAYSAQHLPSQVSSELVNTGFAPVQAGWEVSAYIYGYAANSANGACRVGVRWFNASQQMMSTSWGVASVGAELSTGFGAIPVQALAPEGAAYASLVIEVSAHTVGIWYVDTAAMQVSTATSVVANLTLPLAQVPCDSFGNVLSLAGIETTMQVLIGGSDDSANWTVTKVDGLGITSTVVGRIVRVTSLTVDTSYVDITAHKTGFADIVRRFSVTKNKQGAQGDTGGTGPKGEPGTPAYALQLIASSQVFQLSKTGVGSPSSITFTANLLGGLTGTTTFTVSPSGKAVLTGAGNTRSLAYSGLAVDTDAVTITASCNGYQDSTTVVRLREGNDGNTGPAAISSFLTNETHTVPSEADGSSPILTGATTDIKIFEGLTDVTSSYSYTFSATGCTATKASYTFTVTAMTADVAYVDITGTRASYPTITKRFTLTKSKKGAKGDTGTPGTPGTPGANAKILTLTSTGQVFQIFKNGTNSPSQIVLTATPGGALAGAISWSVTAGTATLTDNTSTSKILTFANMATDAVTIKAAILDGGVEYADFLSIAKVKDGADGLAISSYLTNESQIVPASYDGSNSILTGASTEIKIFNGTTDESSSWTVTKADSAGITSTLATRTVTVTAMTVDTGYVDITATRTGYSTIVKRFTLTKSKAGTPGSNGAAALSVDISSTAQAFTFDGAGAAQPTSQTITFTLGLQNLVIGDITGWGTATLYDSAGTSLGTVTMGGTGATRTLTIAQFAAAYSAKITATHTASGLTDTITVVRLRQGADGSPTVTALLTNESHTLSANTDGTVGSYAGASTEIKVYIGTSDDSANWAATKVDSSGVTSTLSGKVVTVTAMTVDTGYVDITVTKTNYSPITKRFSISKSKTGADGSPGTPGTPGVNALTAYLTAETVAIGCDYNGYPPAGTLASTTMVVMQGTTNDSANWGFTVTPASSTSNVVYSQVGGTITVTGMSNTIDTAELTIVGTRSGYPTLTKKFLLSKAKAGTTGTRGSMEFYINGATTSPLLTAWSDTAANTAIVTTGASYTGGYKVIGDTVTEYRNDTNPPWAVTKFWANNVWNAADTVLDGNLLVKGTVAAKALAAKSVTAEKLSIGIQADNLWPNGTSEDGLAPPGETATNAQFGWVQSSAYAYAGSYRRYYDNSLGSAQVRLVLSVPCVPGDAFSVEAMCAVGTVSQSAGVYIMFGGVGTTPDSTTGWLSGSEGGGNYVCQTTGYSAVNYWSRAPNNSCWAYIYLFVNASSIGAWDGIVARRMVGSNSITTIDGGKITTGTVIGGIVQTSDYDESPGYPIYGVKLESKAGNPLKIAPEGLQIGPVRGSSIGFATAGIEFAMWGMIAPQVQWGNTTAQIINPYVNRSTVYPNTNCVEITIASPALHDAMNAVVTLTPAWEVSYGANNSMHTCRPVNLGWSLTTRQNTTPYRYTSISFLVGFFSESAFRWLDANSEVRGRLSAVVNMVIRAGTN